MSVNVITDTGETVTLAEHNARLAAANEREAKKFGLTAEQNRFCNEHGFDKASYAAFSGIHNADDYAAHRAQAGAR